MIKSNA
jgi:hypothetical protein